MHRHRYDTPLGPMSATATDAGLTELAFADRPATGGHPHLDRLWEELAAYFAGTLRQFTVPVSSVVGTPFQRKAWAYLTAIPYADRHTYGQQARGMGDANACRAVGRANGSNPVCLVVPCHRVVGADGSLTGFAYGVDKKKWLLDHERRHRPEPA